MLDPKVTGCKRKLAATVCAIFLSGMVAGAFSWHLGERYWLRHQPPVMTEAEKQLTVQHFSQELELNADQVKAVNDLLDEFIMEQANLMQQFQNSRLTEHDQLFQILNEQQRKRFQKVLTEIENKRQD